MRLEFDSATNNIIDTGVIKKLAEFETIIIFGAGQSGEWVFNLLRRYSIQPKCYCDNYQAKWGNLKKGIEIMSFENAIKKYPEAAICVASMWSEEIFKQIKEYDERILERTWDLLTTMAWETSNSIYVSNEPEFICNNIDRFQTLYQLLDDDISKKTLEGLLNYRLTRKKLFLKDIKSDDNIYIDDKIIPREFIKKISQRTIIDGGAFDGDTIETFIQSWGKTNNILDIHCYEIEKRNCDTIRDKQGNFEPHKIHVHQSALWSVKGVTVGIEGDTLSGKVDINKTNNNGGVLTESIDDYGYENVGFIKLDIEGAEREALKGAEKTIKRCHPILAICGYHLQDDLLILSEYIQALHCGYHIYLRHYMYSSGDTLLYAIPDEL